MAKIDPDFPYDAYRFIIQGVRDADKDKVLERFMGGPQQEFERTHGRIQQLLTLIDPDLIEAEYLKYLRAQVGWDENPEVAFVRTLNESQLRKLIRLSVPTLKRKGRPLSIKDMIRIFTGKEAAIRDWFFHRLIIDEAGAYVGLGGIDPFAVGGIFDDVGDELSLIFVNRQGLIDSDKRLLFDLLTYLRPTGEHFGIVYAAFFDEFAAGTSRWLPLGATLLTSFVVTPDEDVAEIDKPHLLRRLQLFQDSDIVSNVATTESQTWTPYQIASLTFVNLDADVNEHVELRMMISADREQYYSARLDGIGNIQLRRGLAGGGFNIEDSRIIGIPPQPAIGSGTDPLPLLIEIESAPQDQASTIVTVGVAGEPFLQKTFVGDEAYVESDGAVELVRDASASALPVLIDDVMVLASPNQIQFVGQKSLLSLGGIANPNPGLEPFVATPDPQELPPHIAAFWNNGATLGLWTAGGDWHLSNFSALTGVLNALWFTDGSEVGTFPNQTVDPVYASTASLASSPAFDLSAFSPVLFDCQIRIIYRPTKKVPLDGGAVPQVREDLILQIDDGGGLTDHATLPTAVEIGGTGFGVNVVHFFPPNLGDPRIGDGSWWQEVVVPANSLVGVAAAQLALRVQINGVYVDTDFGIGVTYVAVEITRK